MGWPATLLCVCSLRHLCDDGRGLLLVRFKLGWPCRPPLHNMLDAFQATWNVRASVASFCDSSSDTQGRRASFTAQLERCRNLVPTHMK